MPGHEPSSATEGIIATGLLAFLFFTGLQSMRTSARLALFTNKLCIAILIAAFIRVHDGWSAVPAAFPNQDATFQNLWYALSRLAFYVAPLGFLAANLSVRAPQRKHVVLTALVGVALPLFGTLFSAVVIGLATHASWFYRPSLSPTLAMALWSRTAGSAAPTRMSVAAITTFGAIRFGARGLADAGSVRSLGRLKWLALGCLVAAIAWLSLHAYAESIQRALEISATCLAITSAVLTANFVTGRRHVERVRRIDCVGVIALLAGLAVALCPPYPSLLDPGDWSHPRLLPSYVVSFFVCLCGRAIRPRHGLS